MSQAGFLRLLSLLVASRSEFLTDSTVVRAHARVSRNGSSGSCALCVMRRALCGRPPTLLTRDHSRRTAHHLLRCHYRLNRVRHTIVAASSHM